MEILDPSLRSPTAEYIGRRVKARLNASPRDKTWAELHPPQSVESVDLRVIPGTGFSSDLISKDAFIRLVGSLESRDRHSENLALCRFAGQFAASSTSDQICRPELLQFLARMRTAGLTNNSGYKALESLAARARTGL